VQAHHLEEEGKAAEVTRTGHEVTEERRRDTERGKERENEKEKERGTVRENVRGSVIEAISPVECAGAAVQEAVLR
jgi:hypothetical protein